jgi:hypothetical protein
MTISVNEYMTISVNEQVAGHKVTVRPTANADSGKRRAAANADGALGSAAPSR